MRDFKARIKAIRKEKLIKFIKQSKQKMRQFNLKEKKKKQLEN